MRKWVVLAGVVVAMALCLSVGYTYVYSRPVFVTMNGKTLMCWPKDMRHVWQPFRPSTFGCLAVQMELAVGATRQWGPVSSTAP